MRFRTAPAVLAVLVSLAAPAPAAAQSLHDSADALVPGRRAISFTLPNGGGAGFGIWRVTAPDRARGFFLTGSGHLSRSSSGGNESHNSDVSITVGPQFRHYAHRSGPVVPFVQTALTVGGGYSRSTQSGNSLSGEARSHSFGGSLGAQLGLGAEWFAFQRVSLSGHTGVAGSVGYSRSTQNLEPGFQSTGSSWNVSFNTFLSSLTAQLYF